MKKNTKKINVLLVLGEPGTGKTTQCKLIAKCFDFEYFSIYHLLGLKKYNIDNLEAFYSALSEKEKIYEVFERLLSEANKKNILLEDFTLSTQKLTSLKKEIKTNINIVGALYFHCPEEIIKYRLFNRKENPINSIENIIKALSSYQNNNNNELIKELEKSHMLLYIDTSKSIDSTINLIKTELQKFEKLPK